MADIRIANLCKAFDGKPVLRDFTAVIPSGRVTAVMGPSGSGKTTLLRILMGLERPGSGQITGLDGLRLSAVFQEDRLMEQLSAVENIRLVDPAVTPAQALALLGGLKMDAPADQPVRELSGGMKRRTALARALLAPYDLLLLDEPFKGLDEATKAGVTGMVREAVRGRTVVLVTHDPEEAAALGAAVVTLEARKS